MQNKEKDVYGSVNSYEVPATQEDEIYEQLSTWKVSHIHRNEVEWVAGYGRFFKWMSDVYTELLVILGLVSLAV